MNIIEGGLRTVDVIKNSSIEFPLVSILIASYNSKESIERTIKSIITQDYPNIELIIVDGLSSDGTQNVLSNYDSYIDYWISEPDLGISDAFNKAVLLSRGDYVNFQGVGDFLLGVNVVSLMMDGIDPKKDIFVCGRIKIVNEFNENEIISLSPKKFKNNFNKLSLLIKMSIPHQGLFTNRSFFNNNGLFDLNLKYAMDYDLLLRAFNKFPNTVMKDVFFSAWRSGGVGAGKIKEVYKEYNAIKIKNNVLPKLLLKIINFYILFKYNIKINLIDKIIKNYG